MNSSPPNHRLFRFGRYEFNEGTQELRMDGQLRPLESKPRLLLQALLAQPQIVISKADLKEAVWPEKNHVEEGSLATAMYSLRRGLEDRDHQIIGVIPGLGYRLTLPVEASPITAQGHEAFAFDAGEPVPGRAGWTLERPLGAPAAGDVWLARHHKTQESRVFKFAHSAHRLDTLKREAAISRLLRTRLGARADIVPILDWNFETRPFFVEMPEGGLDMRAWLRAPETAPDAVQRVTLVARAARIVADAHGAGVLHGDIKPANLLVDAQDGHTPQIRLVDFGGGGLTDAARAEALTLSLDALSDQNRHGGGHAATGSLIYLAPELQAGGGPTVAGDIYALGILLYQMVVGSLDKPLAAGWEQDVPDEMLRDDIAAAAAGDIRLRLPSAAVLADRLKTLDVRRRERMQLRMERAETARLAESSRRAQQRRPWITLAAGALLLGLTASGIAAWRAERARDEALRQARIAQAVNLFLTDDLLGRGNPVNSGKVNETLMEAVSNAEPRIAFRLAREPLVAASIYSALAQVFASRGSFPDARAAFASAVAAFGKAQGPDSADAVITRLRQAQMEAIAAEAGSLTLAKTLIDAAAPHLAALGKRADEARVWMLAAAATLNLMGGDVALSRRQFEQTADLADTMPAAFDSGTRLVFRQHQAFAAFRLGQWQDADALLQDLLRRQMALHGPLHPDTLLVRLNLAQVQMGRGEAAAAIASLDDSFLRQLTTVFGTEHHAVLTALAARARALMHLGRYTDALRDNRAVYSAAVAKQGEASQFAILALTDIARAQCRNGQIGEGVGNAARAYDTAVAAFRETPIIAQDVSLDLAACLIADKQYRQAGQLLSKIDRNGVAQFEATPEIDAEIDLMLTQIAVAAGDRAKALGLLAIPERAFNVPNADPYLQSQVHRAASAAAGL